MNRRPNLHVVSIEGSPTDAERRVIQATLAKSVGAERQARSGSGWLRAARAQGRRLGMYDYHDRFDSADAWRLSLRFPPGGREYPGLVGRGDAR